MTTLHELSDFLYRDLSASERSAATSARPFSRDCGVLGDGFTAASMMFYTGEQRWEELLQQHVGTLTEALYNTRVNRVGLSNGLTGFLLLLDTAGQYVDVRAGVTAALERRVGHLADEIMTRMRGGPGIDRCDYGFATGLAGVAHRLFLVGREERLAQRIANLFADLAVRPFPYSFWTPAVSMSGGLLGSRPELSFGGRDLSFGMGVAGVVGALRQAEQFFGEPRYLDAAAVLVDDIVADAACHGGRTVSAYQVPPMVGSRPGPSAPVGHTWAAGLPGLESAVAGSPELMRRLYGGLSYGEDYLDARSGGFLRPGLCDGVAGRLYLADMVGLPDDPRWARLAGDTLDGYATSSPGTPDAADPGFWEGLGGTVAVWFGREGGRGYAPPLVVLGAGGNCPRQSDSVPDLDPLPRGC